MRRIDQFDGAMKPLLPITAQNRKHRFEIVAVFRSKRFGFEKKNDLGTREWNARTVTKDQTMKLHLDSRISPTHPAAISSRLTEDVESPLASRTVTHPSLVMLVKQVADCAQWRDRTVPGDEKVEIEKRICHCGEVISRNADLNVFMGTPLLAQRSRSAVQADCGGGTWSDPATQRPRPWVRCQIRTFNPAQAA